MEWWLSLPPALRRWLSEPVVAVFLVQSAVVLWLLWGPAAMKVARHAAETVWQLFRQARQRQRQARPPAKFPR